MIIILIYIYQKKTIEKNELSNMINHLKIYLNMNITVDYMLISNNYVHLLLFTDNILQYVNEIFLNNIYNDYFENNNTITSLINIFNTAIITINNYYNSFIKNVDTQDIELNKINENLKLTIFYKDIKDMTKIMSIRI